MALDPRNILVIHFGQLGDVVLGLPAMRLIAQRFPVARMTALTGLPASEIVRMTGDFDEVIAVDRVRLLRGNKGRSTLEILNLTRRIRKRRFDLVIDLHSLPETNLLGYFSGAPLRLYAHREGRSFDRLSNFHPPPPAEDKSLHVTTNYVNALRPIGVESVPAPFVFRPAQVELEKAAARLPDGWKDDGRIVGINPGAGHPSRCWDLANFIEVARRIRESGSARVAVFLGPEEAGFRERIVSELGEEAAIFDRVTLPELATTFSLVDVLVSNDTGPMHLAAAAGASIVLLMHRAAPVRYVPLGRDVEVIRGEGLESIDVDRVYDATLRLLAERPGRSIYENPHEKKKPEKDHRK